MKRPMSLRGIAIVFLAFFTASADVRAAAPTANPQSVTTAFNTPRAITLTGTDDASLPLTYSIVANPVHGTLSGTAPNVTYQPATGYSGADSFTFRVNNGHQNSSPATVSITITAPAAPTANPQNVTTSLNTASAITLTGSDPIGLPLTYTIVANPVHGTLSGTAPNVTYHPTTGYSGVDSFTFRVNNGFQNSSPATVSITVTAPAAPTANPQNVTTSPNTAAVITLTGSDPTSLPLTYSIVANPVHGTLSGTAPNVTYHPAAGYTGADSFTFRVNNGSQNSGPATISIAVVPQSGAITLDPPQINVNGSVALNGVITITPSPCCVTEFYVWTLTPMEVPIPASPITRTQAGFQLSLAALNLQLGTYELRVHASSGTDTSPDAVKTLTLVSSTLSGLRVFPNPWRSDQDSGVGITFDHLTPGAVVKIFDIAGHWVRSVPATADSAVWDRLNDRGDAVASGMYLYLITDNQGGKARGKLTVIK